MYKNRMTLNDILYDLVVFIVFYSAAVFSDFIFYKDITVVYKFALLIVPFYAAFWLRRVTKKLFVFLGAIIALAVACVFIQQGFSLRLWVGGVMAATALYTVIKRVSGSDSDFTNAFAFTVSSLMIVLSFASVILKHYAIVPVFSVNVVVVLISKLLWTQIYNMDSSLELITRNTVQPVKNIVSFNNKIIFVFIVAAVVIMVLSRYYRIDAAITFLGVSFLNFLRYLASLSKDEPPVATPQPQNASRGGGQPDLAAIFGPGKTSAFFAVLEQALMFLTMVGLVVGVFALIWYVCFSIYRGFYANRKDDADYKELFMPDIFIGKTKISLRDFFTNYPTNRIRRMFYKKVKKNISKGVPIEVSDTAMEISEKIQSENIRGLAAEYERARYGRV